MIAAAALWKRSRASAAALLVAACWMVALTALALAPTQRSMAVATGASHGVLLKPDGGVWTWGDNTEGQLGVAEAKVHTPVRVAGLSAVKAIAAGDHFTLAVTDDGDVWAWGEGDVGQLGVDLPKGSPRPVRIPQLSGVVAVAAAGDHALAMTSDGAVWAWGDKARPTDPSAPKPVEGLAGVIAIAVSQRHSVALKADGTVWVWGDHGAGDLGNGDYGMAARPIRIPGLSDVTAIAAGYQLTLAARRDGTVWAIGYGAAGGLGDGQHPNESNTPVQVSGLTHVVALAAGAMHALALKADGTVWSWGYNHDGQLGAARISAEQSDVPVRTDTLVGVAAIGAGNNHSVVVTQQGVLWGWGENDGGQLGVDPETLPRSQVPARVGGAVPGACNALYACTTDRGKIIEICGDQDETDPARWTRIQYRYGAEQGPPELVFPKTPGEGPPPLYFSHQTVHGEYRLSVRFSTGGHQFRVFADKTSGGGVEVSDTGGKRLATIQCNESPAMFGEYLRRNLPCDPENPHGAAACRESPVVVK